MKKLRKYMIALFCLCMTAYAVPSFADGGEDEIEPNGSKEYVDVNVTDYKQVGGTAQAVFANRSSINCSYELVGINIAGVKEELASGTLAPGQAIVSAGTPVATDTIGVFARIWQPGDTKGLESEDVSFAVKY